MKTTDIILWVAAISTGMIAGLFYSWTVSVTPGLARLSDKGYIESFQSMNDAILNPAFFMTFIGTLIILPVGSWVTYTQDMPTRLWLLIAATIAYTIGVFGVTVVGNVPMNEALAAIDTSTASLKDLRDARLGFEHKWNFLNTIRTFSSCVALALVTLACLFKR